MAKKRKIYKKRPLWYFILIYAIVGAIIYSLLYFSGITGNYNNQTPQEKEIQYFE